MIVEIPTAAEMIARCGGFQDNGHQPIKPGSVASEYLPEADELAPVNIADKLAVVRFNVQSPPPEEATTFQTTHGATIATRGNISALTAQAKAGKSAWVAALIASAITPRPEDCDLLGIRAVNPEGLPILLLDTEHSPFHHHAICDRILRRAMLTESEQLHAYRLAGFTVADLNAALEHLLSERKWLAVFLDGTGDFVADVNDAEECNAFVSRLHGQAIKNDTHIVNVLHLNPASDFKSRGHLGSQLERKAESNLRIEKADEISVVFADKNRGAAILKTNGPRFAWSNEHQMHVSIESGQAASDADKLESLTMLAAELFADQSSLKYSEMIKKLTAKNGLAVSERTAARKLSELSRLKLIEKTSFGLWKSTL